jgi:hypothetical protein
MQLWDVPIKMNALFTTQSKGLEMFYDVMQAMNESLPLNKTGFYMADSRFFQEFSRKQPQIESRSFHLLKEWEIVRDSQNIKPDIQLLESYEKKIGRSFLWNALVADRRIYFGRKYAFAQDYHPRFSHERMLSILQLGLTQMERLFDEVQPDFVASFQCVTIGDYLSYLFARARNIPVLNLRPTRIRNLFYAGESILEPSQHLKRIYEKFIKDDIVPELKNDAADHLKVMRGTHAMYEGVAPVSNRPPAVNDPVGDKSILSMAQTVITLLTGEYKYRFGEYKYDNHVSGYIEPMIAKKITRPLRASLMEKKFAKSYVRTNDLPGLNYAFFPLHTEPEVTLSVYSKAYLNQLETARLFSHNLPVGMKLVVKEHPWAIGKRPISYYRKLLEIPNVMLAHPGIESKDLITNANLITVIAGSIGFEGLVFKKPVIVLGRAPFGFLPEGMIRHVTNPERLSMEIKDLLENYEHDENVLISYVAAIIRESVPVDFYTRLLGRKGAYNPDMKGGDRRDDEIRTAHIKRLAEYLEKRVKDMKKEMS